MTAPTFFAAFESTYLPLFDVDVAEIARHDTTWRDDLHHVLEAGVNHLRYPMRWHRIEKQPGVFDWSQTDEVMAHFSDHNVYAIIDFVHHTSYPRWLSDGFRDPRFPRAFIEYVDTLTDRYPNIAAYTLFNEPLATFLMCGSEGLWPPYDKGIEGLARLTNNVMPALSAAAQLTRERLPQAHHVWVDTCEFHTGTSGAPQEWAETCNDRRHFLLDAALGHDIDDSRPFLKRFIAAGGQPTLEISPFNVDVIGLDYYEHSEWFYDKDRGHAPPPALTGFAAISEQYYKRYQRPMMLSETNRRGTPRERIEWLSYMLSEYQAATDSGVDLQGFCWFPYLDSCDWDSLLALPHGHIDPVGVMSMTGTHRRQRTIFTAAWEAAARGEAINTSEEHMTDLIVISHLRWNSVWQRPHHLVSRLSRFRHPGRVYFVEEPQSAPVTEPTLAVQEQSDVTVIQLLVPPHPDHAIHVGFDALAANSYRKLLGDYLTSQRVSPNPDVFIYTPMGLELAESLKPGHLYYDVMDDLASFKNAPAGLILRQQRLLQLADVVFTGGPSLHAGITLQRARGVHLFRSGVETDHYRRSREFRRPRETKVAGYVGVIDERIDLELVAQLAQALPDWQIQLVGPVTKIEETDLPQADNLKYFGRIPYAELPEVMASMDVALMPFALNEATRSISPTKTLEYLAAGLPVVSTRVPDVVADYERIVHLADTGLEFARACREVITHSRHDRDEQLAPIQQQQEWDYIAQEIHNLMNQVVIDLRAPARLVGT